MKTSMLSLLAIMGILLTGTIPGQQLVFADNDELKVEIEIEDGVAKIEVEWDDDEYEFKLATSDIDEILEVTSLRTGIPVDLLEEAMILEVKDEDDDHYDERDEDDDRDEYDYSDFSDSDTLEKKLRASTLGDSSEVKIELEFLTDTTDPVLLVDEILENFLVTQEEAEDLLKIQDEDDELDEEFTVEIETKDGITEVEVELEYILDSTDRDEIIASIVENSQLDVDLLLDAINFSEESDDSSDGTSDDNGSTSDSDSDGVVDNSELEALREENRLLREEIKDLKEQLANLNQLLMEQIRVIMDTLSALKS